MNSRADVGADDMRQERLHQNKATQAVSAHVLISNQHKFMQMGSYLASMHIPASASAVLVN